MASELDSVLHQVCHIIDRIFLIHQFIVYDHKLNTTSLAFMFFVNVKHPLFSMR